ncbi:MAG TPA: hypothetical protein VLA89_10205 [Gemmatimonadales bacterium]|nr:hypothetical protein [Gemmatimonadales bacterium]
MKLSAFLVALVALPLIASGALATTPEAYEDPGAVVRPAYRPSPSPMAAQFRQEVTLKPPPLHLPNIAALTKALAGKPRPVLERQSILSSRVIRFWNGKGKWLRATRHTKCWEVPWQRSCTVARASYRLHSSLRQKAEQRLWELDRTIQNTDNWVRAMRYAQTPFPGTIDWLEFISNRECRACWTTPGGFICNYQGSGACGPMQFMSGTFYGHADDARDYLASHGYVVDPGVWDWHNALGQALTAAYMRYTGQDACHWCL